MSKPPLRILHLSVMRALPEGVRKQLCYEVEASGALNCARWDTLAVHAQPAQREFERRIPWIFRGILLRSLYGWLLTAKLAPQYDFVLVRHMPFDPSAYFFAPFIRNRLSVHHAKEIEELPLIAPGLKGRIAAFAERHAGAFAVRKTIGVLGVTRELGAYEAEMWAPDKPHFHYPNGIAPDRIAIAGDDRDDKKVSAVFICGKFTAWHGLDRLIDAISQSAVSSDQLRIDLVGELSDSQRRAIEALGERAAIFEIHGYLPTEDYRRILARSDIGIGSLAMDRQNLTQGATLKVRELLCAGIPVISGHADTALSVDFPYYGTMHPTAVDPILEMGRKMKHTSRQDVRDSALPYIGKGEAMEGVVGWLRSQFRS